jgi:hypothetical protein
MPQICEGQEGFIVVESDKEVGPLGKASSLISRTPHEMPFVYFVKLLEKQIGI